MVTWTCDRGGMLSRRIGSVIPLPKVEYVKQLRNKLLSEIDADDLDEGPDAEAGASITVCSGELGCGTDRLRSWRRNARSLSEFSGSKREILNLCGPVLL